MRYLSDFMAPAALEKSLDKLWQIGWPCGILMSVGGQWSHAKLILAPAVALARLSDMYYGRHRGRGENVP